MNSNLSNRVSHWSVLPTAALHGSILEMQSRGEQIIDLTIGISNRPIPNVGKEESIKAIENNNIPYTAIGGSTDLKMEIQKKLERGNDIKSKISNIIVTTGAKQALFEALYVLTNPGDEVGMIKPYWPAFTQMLNVLGLKGVFIDMDEIGSLSKNPLRSKMKVLLFNNPHNPTGKVFGKDQLTDIVSFAKENNIFIISDESYEELIYEGEHISLCSISDYPQILTIFSASQSFSMMGWRLGYAVGDSEIINAMEAVQSSITAAPSAVAQVALKGILSMQGSYVKDLVNDFRRRRDEAYEKLKAIDWIGCEKPSSGPYFWCDISELTKDSIDFSTSLLKEKKVAVMPGDSFGSEGRIRIAFNANPTQVLIDAIERISEFGEKSL